MEKTKDFLFTVLKKMFNIHSVSTKIALTCLIDCLLLMAIIGGLFSRALSDQEMKLMDNRLHSDLEMLDAELTRDFGRTWVLENGTLYCGSVPIGDGTEEKAFLEPFVKLEEQIGTYCYCLMRSSDEGLQWRGDEKTGYQEGHYIRVAGSTRGVHNESLVGTHLNKQVSDVIDKGKEFAGVSNVDGRQIYSVYRPIKDPDGEIVGMIVVGRDMAEMKRDVREATTGSFLALGIIILLGGAVIFLITAQSTTDITKVEQYLDRITDGELPEEKLKIRSKDEIGCVADSINEMVESLRDKERMGTELSLATEIQARMLPTDFPAFPDHTEFDLFASMSPAKEVGGDFYDFFLLDNTHLVISAADVSGKGVPAALYMVVTKTLIRNYIQMGMAPEKAFSVVNHILCENNHTEMFVTAWLGVIDLVTGELTFVNAGHNPPYIRHKGGDFEPIRSLPGFVLGGMDGLIYKHKVIPLVPGDKIFLYTDGVTEATNPDQELYGTERLRAYLDSHATDKAEEIVEGLRSDIDMFVGIADQFDDITMLLFDFKHNLPKDAKDVVRFPATDEALPDAQAFVEEYMEKAGFGMKETMQVQVAFEEIFVNIAHYAYPNMDGMMSLSVAADDEGIRIQFIDSGVPFNPLEKEDPDVTASAEDRKIGGLGIYMVKSTMDDVQYEYKDNRNILTIYKKKG